MLSNSASFQWNLSLYQMWSMKGLLCSAVPFLWTLHFCSCVMEAVAVYLGVRFGTGRGEALRLFDCFIMVIYMAIYLCILCYVCHYMYTSECLFVCVHVLVCVCVWLSKEGSVFGPPCELGWVTAWASRLSQYTHTHTHTCARAHTGTHTQAHTVLKHTSASSFFNMFSTLLMSHDQIHIMLQSKHAVLKWNKSLWDQERTHTVWYNTEPPSSITANMPMYLLF